MGSQSFDLREAVTRRGQQQAPTTIKTCINARDGSLGVKSKILRNVNIERRHFTSARDPARSRAGSPAQRRGPRRRPATGELRHTPGRRRRRSPKYFCAKRVLLFSSPPPMDAGCPPGPKTRVFFEIPLLGPLRRPNGHGDITPKCLVSALAAGASGDCRPRVENEEA